MSLNLDLDRIRERLRLAAEVLACPRTEENRAAQSWCRVYSTDVRALRAAYNRARGLLRGTDSQLLDILRQMEEQPDHATAADVAARRLRSILDIAPGAPLPKRPSGYPGL